MTDNGWTPIRHVNVADQGVAAASRQDFVEASLLSGCRTTASNGSTEWSPSPAPFSGATSPPRRMVALRHSDKRVKGMEYEG